MKIWYLLIGFMICVAGTGAIQPSVGFFDAEDSTLPTPFLIFGHVWYEGGAPCNSPIVSISSNGTSWPAETHEGCNYYQILLPDVGDVIEWNVTDGAGFNTTDQTVNTSDLERGEVFGIDFTLEAPPVTPLQPRAPFVICGWVNYTNGAPCGNLSVNITNLNTGAVRQAKTLAGYGYYELILNSTDVISGVTLSFNATDMTGFNSTNHTITEGDLNSGGVFEVNLTLASVAPRIIGCAPDSPVNDTENATRRFNITIDQTVNVTWLINGAIVQTNKSTTESSYTNTSAAAGIQNVSARANNTNGTDRQEWVWNVMPPISEPSTILLIYGNVPYKNGTPCDSPFVVVTNLNTSEKLIADNRTGESFYQLVTSSAFAKAGDVLMINASKNGTPVGDATHTVNQTEIEDGAINMNINEDLADAPDFTVTDILFNPSEPLIGDLVAINATILNAGAEGEAYVEFYDNKSIFITKNTTLTLPGALKIRVFFHVFYGNITIYNETGVVERLIVEEHEPEFDYWTKWCDGATIRIEGGEGLFMIDRYEALLANGSITLGRGNSTNVSAVWNLSDQYMGWATNGTHGITVRADPYNQVIESDETNNNRTEAIDINPSLDFAVTNITFSNNEPVLGDLVGINATIWNYGVRNGTTVVTFSYDNISTEKDVPLANITVTLNVTESKVVFASWQTGTAYGGARDHNITVEADLYDTTSEENETNNSLSKQLFVNGTDLAVTAIEMPCGGHWGNCCYVGQDVNVTATILNIGAVDATNVTVIFRDGTETGEHTFNETHIERLNSGENITVSVMWNPLETGNHTIAVSILPYDVLTDNNETNNELFGFSCVKPGYDFLVEGVNVELQKDVRRGESVNITATIGNIGQGSGNVSIAFFVNSTDYAGTCGERFTRIGTIDCVYAKVNETETVSINWDVDVSGGSHLIAAVVNPDNKIDEINDTEYAGGLIRFRGTGNNVKTCILQVLPNDLTMTDLTLYPAEPNIGDLVNVSAKIRNNGNTSVESTVGFYMEQDIPTIPCTQVWSTPMQPEDVMMRVHFDYMGGNASADWPGSVKAYVNDSQGQHKQIYFYYKDEGGAMVKVLTIDKNVSYTERGSVKRWTDVWTEWSYGATIEIHPSGIEGWTFDKYQVMLGNSTVTLGAGDLTKYYGAWNASPPLRAGENYTLMANVADQKSESEIYLGGTDLTITNLSVEPVVMDGDGVWVNVTIGNPGSMNATDFIVNVTEIYSPTSQWHPITHKFIHSRDDHYELINTARIEGIDAGNSINIPIPWNASIREIVCSGDCVDSGDCVWKETARKYRIRVEINLLENKDKEASNIDHEREPIVDVYESRDFKVTDFSFSVNGESRNSSEIVVYDEVTLNATLQITNLANHGGSVDVGFYIDSDKHEIGNTTVVFPVGNGTEYAEIKWNVDIPGDHNMIVVVDLENRIYEIDGDQNTTYTQPIYMMASDLVLESPIISPESPVRGETASINVTLSNRGDADASSVNLTIYEWAEGHIEDADNESRVGCKQIVISKDNATAMRLYLDLEVDCGRVYFNGSSGREIVHYDGNFHGWTPWVLDNNTTVVVTGDAYARVSKVYYILSSSIIDTSTHDLVVDETKKIIIDWNPSSVGERFIAAIVDPEDRIIEHDESNNRLVEFIQVQTADIEVFNLSLRWLNGTVIDEDEIIRDGDDVTISANLTNIGVENATSFDVRLLVNDLLITNETVGGLAPNESIYVSTDWSATVGDRLLKVEADYVDEINETNETNNIVALERYVYGAELSGNTSWVTSGLYGEILFESDQPYDEDEVNITAMITNSGYVPAENFSAAMFFGHTPFTCHKTLHSQETTTPGWRWLTDRSYADAVYIYLNISISGGYPRLAIYDGNGMELEKVDRSCWVRVPGDAVRVDCWRPTNYDSDYTVSFYPVYPDNLSQIMELDVNSSIKLPPLKRNVSVFEYHVVLFIDPENKVPEDEDYREDNVIHRIMHVTPIRDFTVTNVTASQTNLSDLDTPNIIAGVSNIGLRNGTVEVDFVDYEVEYRGYGYHFDINRSPPYLPIPPDARLSGLQYGRRTPRNYDNLMIIHRPGVDAITLHFDMISLAKSGISSPYGVMAIYGEEGDMIWSKKGGSDGWGCAGGCEDANIPIVPGETVYICTNDRAHFNLSRYTTETEFHRGEVRLNASKTWNESKNVTPIRTAYTGDHTIVVTLDRDDEISEIDESNNEDSSLFHVNASRDPVIVGINITPEQPKDGEDVNITAVVTNNGFKNASFTFGLWANTTRDKGYALEANLTTNLSEDRTRYIRLLNHSDLTLAPGENRTVNVTWNNISVSGSPKHHIIAIVDPTDEIDEINETNNEMVTEVIMAYPDFGIGGSCVPKGEEYAVVTIIEAGGASGASDVTVRFESSETEKRRKSIGSWSWGSITHDNTASIQIHFEHLRAWDGCVEVKDSLNIAKQPIATYCGVELWDKWGPWVQKDTVHIVCPGAGTYAEIDKYRWGNVSDEQIDLPAGDSEHVKIPWAYECPRMVNVTVDPDNNITEIDENNNEESVLMYADLRAGRIEFVSPAQIEKWSLDAEKFVIDGTIANGEAGNGIVVPASDFNVTLEFRELYPNGTVGDPVFNMTEHVEDPLCVGVDRIIRFEFDPSEALETAGNYTVFLIVDSSGDVCESSDSYPPEDDRYRLGEWNNLTSENLVVRTTGYGGGELITVAQGEVNGRVVYTIDNSEEFHRLYPGVSCTVDFDDVIPSGVDVDSDIEVARLFVYWYTWHQDDDGNYVPVLADLDVGFNDGHNLGKAGNYSDHPDATVYDTAYGLDTYDVTDYLSEEHNEVAIRNSQDVDWYATVKTVGLLVVYRDDKEPLTKYWINEGADVQLAKNMGDSGSIDDLRNTWLAYDKCIALAQFKDVESEDLEGMNATLLMILGTNSENILYPGAGGVGDMLQFNDQSIGSLMSGAVNKRHWKPVYDNGISFTKNRWEDVTDHLKRGNNEAAMGSRGNFIMPANAFLRLIFPPDLNVIDLTAPKSTVVGAHHSINATIRNDGRSDAHDFNVTFYIDRKQMVRIPHLDLPAGENMTIHLYNWTPMLLMHSYNLTVAADVLSGEDWTEIETDNNALTKHVIIEEGGFGNQTGPRGTGGGSNPTGGEYTETITGRVMEGMTFSTFGGGGGAGMFSALEWIMKGAVWLVLVLFVYAGYRVEQRSYGRVRVGLRQPYL